MFWKKMLGVCKRFLYAHWKSILYYGAVAAVLCAVAYAAEEYRKDEKYTDMVLPAAEITETAKEDTIPELELPDGMCQLREFSEKPVWNEILQQWENHMAVDFALTDDEVRALSGGVVRKTGCDSRFGNYIEIASGELVLRYGSVSADSEIGEGREVKAGERIGTAENSMVCEDYLGKHLHLEAVYKGKSADAMLFAQNGSEVASNS